MGVMDNFLKQIGTGDTIHDYQHAARIFTDSTMRLSPKYAFLFYVKFTMSPDTSPWRRLTDNDVLEIGALAKSASLPKFTVDNKVMNAYNRPNIVQSKMKYDPVVLRFHDDSASLMREFWYDYYTYYYRDSDHPEAVYNSEHKYVTRQRDNWGYTLKPDAAAPGIIGVPAKLNVIQSISIYSMSQKQFHEYVLINPTITQFQHGEHNASESTGVMEHTMQITYESVKYRRGTVTDQTMAAMLLHYDKTPSPLSPAGGGTRTIFGPGGLINATQDISADLAAGNFLAAAITAARVGQTFKGVNLGQVAKAEGLEGLNAALRTGNNPYSAVTVPGAASVLSSLYSGGLAVASVGAAVGTMGALINGGVQQAQQLVGSSPSTGVNNGVTVANNPTLRDEGINNNATPVTSNGNQVSIPVSSLNESASPEFPQLSNVAATSGSTFVVPANGDPIATLNNANEVISGSTQGQQSNGTV
jgi:hypothetical protein